LGYKTNLILRGIPTHRTSFFGLVGTFVEQRRQTTSADEPLESGRGDSVSLVINDEIAFGGNSNARMTEPFAHHF